MADNINDRLFARGYSSGTSGYGKPATGRTSTQAPETNCAPPCADCGRLDCLCRPRFFAGQLLSEQDLNRLDAYIRAKNKLHTLQLHGWGVVNGLEVRCEPCGSGVVVGKGYAISPCGDDIIVCCDTPVDICSLIQKCTPPDNTCKPYQGATANNGCDEVIQDWVLAIRYTETPARGVTALRMGASCSCGASGGSCSSSSGGRSSCGCGAKPSTSGGCGCGARPASSGSCGCAAKPASTTMATAATATRPRKSSPECEPTVICEGYAWDVFPAPKTTRGDGLSGELIDRIKCCLQPIADVLPTMPSTPTVANFDKQADAWNRWCCQAKAALLAYFSTGPESNCTLVEKLGQWSCPDPTVESFGQQMLVAWELLVLLLLEAILACLCSALLPPAPCGTSDDRVPLAVVRVRKKDCAVVEVCNWTPLRKLVLTFPTLEYWFGWIPLFAALRDGIHNLCCNTLRLRGVGTVNERSTTSGAATAAARYAEFARPAEAARMRANTTLSPTAASDNEIFATLVADALKRGTQPLEPNAVVGGMFDLQTATAHPLSKTELENAPQFLLLNQVMRPLVANLFQQEAPAAMLRSFVGGAAATHAAPAAAAASADDVAKMKERIATLEETVKHLQTTTHKK